MAILKGFPSSSTISPSVRIKETDLSLILPSSSTTLSYKTGLVGFASKGPINTPTLISSKREFNRIFGYAHPDVSDPYLIYAAEQFLLVADQLYVVRVADDSPVSDEQALTAEVDIPASGSVVQIESDTAGPYTFLVDSFFRWRLNGVLASKTLVVLAGIYTTDELVENLNDQLDSVIDGIEFYATTDDKIAVQSTFAYGPDASIELVSVQDAMYGGEVVDGNPTGLGTGMLAATITGSRDRYPVTSYQVQGTYDFTGLTDLNLQVVISGTDNVLIDNVVQVIDFADLEGQSNTIADVVNEINSQALGFTASSSGGNLTLTTDIYGRDAKLLIKTGSTTSDIFGLVNSSGAAGTAATVFGSSPSGVTGDSDVHLDGIVTGSSNGSGAATFVIQADSAGIEGNATQVVISNNTYDGTFNIQVFSNENEVESWGNLSKDSTSAYYIESFLATTSDFIRAVDDTSNPAGPLAGVYTLTGGTDGIPADADAQDALIIGDENTMSGIFALSDPEQVDIDLIAVPGHSSTDVVSEILRLCQEVRGDCFAVIDPPFGLTVSEIIHWQNGIHPLNRVRFDSDFGALYWPWLRMRDATNKVDVWVPPSGSVLAAIARSDQLSGPWFPPAGLTRGALPPNISDVFSRPTLEERDLMYGFRNAINPIVSFNDVDGFIIFGQKTLQRAPTALDRVSVRRMMIFIEKQIKRQSRLLLFEPHDETLREQFVSLAENILETVKGQRGITDYRVQCDSELNPADVIDRNELRARIGVQPTRAVEFIFIDFSIHRTGSFTENADNF